MGQAIGDLLPSAIGVALSPVPIIAVILILGTPKARSNGPAFALGWVLGLVVVSVIVLFVAGGSDDADSASSTTVDVIKLLIGLLFLLLALKQWQGRPQPGQEATMPTFMLGSLTVAGPVPYFLVAGERAVTPLASIKAFMAAHNAVIMMVVFLVLGAKLIGNGIAGLSDG